VTLSSPTDNPSEAEVDVEPIVSGEAVPTAALGPTEVTPHHPLALDPSGNGFWNRIDRVTFGVTDRLNPILVKEARESLKSSQFLITFFLLLAATLLWTGIGIVFNAPQVYYLPTGASLLAGYYFLMAVPIFGLVPLTAYRSLSSEIDNDTFELMSITGLGSFQIVRGKFLSAVLQMFLHFAAVVPSLAFTYLLRGVGLSDICMVLLAVFMAGLFLTAFALMIAPLLSGFLGQSFAMVGLVAAILVVQFIVAIMCLSGILGAGVGSDSVAWMLAGITAVIVLSFVVLFLKAAAAQIAPVTENRSTSLRRWMLVQQFLWVAAIAGTSLFYDDFEPINFGSFVLAAYWLVMGSMFLSESTEISPRVRRELPSTFLGRVFLTAFTPGPSSGYLFALCSGGVAIFATGLFGTLMNQKVVQTECTVYSLAMIGYLTGYLGLVRLLSLPLACRGLFPLPAAVVVLGTVLMFSLLAPSVILVIATGNLPQNYSDLQLLNWAWTSMEGFSSGGLPAYLCGIAFLGGLIPTAINLLWMPDLYMYRKVAVPARVRADRDSQQNT